MHLMDMKSQVFFAGIMISPHSCLSKREVWTLATQTITLATGNAAVV